MWYCITVYTTDSLINGSAQWLLFIAKFMMLQLPSVDPRTDDIILQN